MDAASFIEASRELRGRFYSLIDSLSTLRGLASLEVRHRDEHALLAEALEVLLRHQDLERCSVFLVEDGRARFAAGRHWEELVAADRRRPSIQLVGAEPPAEVGAAVMEQVIASAHTIHCRDWSREGTNDGSAAVSTRARGSFLCVPIVVRGDVVGVVNVYHPEPNALESWHEHTIELFCSVLAHMLDNNRLLRSLERTVEDRTRQLEAALREAQQLKRRYEELSHVDELTGLHNRRFFFPEAEALLARAIRYAHPFSLLLIDIDRFKRINDEHGHGTGDEVLRDVAKAVRGAIREGDIIARFGGEEFVVALPNTSIDGATQLAERIRTTVSELRWSAISAEPKVTASFGLTTLGEHPDPDSKTSLEKLLREADAAMYEAKAQGRDRVVVNTARD